MIKKDAYSLFSRGLNSYMSRKGYTLDDVAKILDITAQSVHAIRSGKTLPRFDKVFTLVENGMTLYEIFGTELAEKLTAEMKDDEFIRFSFEYTGKNEDIVREWRNAVRG